MKKVIISLAIIIILAGAVYAFTQWRKAQQAAETSNLRTVLTERGDLVATIGATGVVRSNQTAILTWQTTGTVDQVHVQAGDMVDTDQVLTSLQKTSLSQNIILAQVELNNAKKTLDDLNKTAEDAKIAAMQAISNSAQAVKHAQYQLDNYIVPSDQAELETMEALDVMQERLDQARAAFEPYKYFSSGNKERQELKEALNEAQSDYNAAVKRLDYEYQLEVARANLERAREDYDKWKDGPDPDDVANAEARMAAAQATINLARITAPFAGSITSVMAKPGDQVAPGKVAFQIDDLAKLLVDVLVSEVDINQIRVGQDVTLTFDAILDKEYHGLVTEVDQVGTSTQGVVDFTVTVELDDVDEDVKPGMTAAVNIIVEQKESVLLIPNRAVRIKDGERVVYILKDGQPSSVVITLGVSSETMSEVVEGELETGDLIVLNPPMEFESDGPPPFAR